MENFDFIPFDGRQDLIEFTDGYSGESVYWGADGDDYYNAKGEKLKGFLQKFKKGGSFWQKGVGKGLSKIGKAIVKAERKIIGKNKDKVKGSKEGTKDTKKGGAELTQSQTNDGKNVLTQKLPNADANTPADKIVDIGGQKLSTVDVPADKPIVVATDPNTGAKTVGVEFNPEETTAIKGQDGNYSYYRNDKVSGGDGSGSGMSSTTKIAIAVGGVLVVGLIVYLIAKRNK